MSTSAQPNWDDLKFVLAVAEEGSVAGAARSLGVNHATVLRRVTGFETRHGLKVFEKTPSGYRIASDRLALIEALRNASTAVGHVERLITSERPGQESRIRITSTDAFCRFLLPEIISTLSQQIASPVSVLVANQHLDFGRLQADITLRPAQQLPEDLSGIKAARFRFGVYGVDGGDDAWLGLEGPIARSSAGGWRDQLSNSAPSLLGSDSFLMLAALAAQGRGMAVLPCFVGDAFPGLIRMAEPEELPMASIWVASHVDLAESGRLRKARNIIAEEVAKREPILMGETSG